MRDNENLECCGEWCRNTITMTEFHAQEYGPWFYINIPRGLGSDVADTLYEFCSWKCQITWAEINHTLWIERTENPSKI
jgi:hypothetical protein